MPSGSCASLIALDPEIFSRYFLDFPEDISEAAWKNFPVSLSDVRSRGLEARPVPETGSEPVHDFSDPEDLETILNLCLEKAARDQYSSAIPQFFSEYLFSGNLFRAYPLEKWGRHWEIFSEIIEREGKTLPWWLDRLFDESAYHLGLLEPDAVKALCLSLEETAMLEDLSSVLREKGRNDSAGELESLNRFFKSIKESGCWLLSFEPTT